MIEDVTGYIDLNSIDGDLVVVFDNPIVTKMCSVPRLTHFEVIDYNEALMNGLKPGDAVVCKVKMSHGASERPLLKVTKIE